MIVNFRVNGRDVSADVQPNTPLLWVLRDELGVRGPKFGCGIAQCGACTVHLDGAPTRSCSTPVQAVEGTDVLTIEGLSPDGTHPLQEAWKALDVPQCGYCQAGQIMSAAALLRDNPQPTDADIDAAMAGNLCRCGTYLRIRRAIHRAAGTATDDTESTSESTRVDATRERAPSSRDQTPAPAGTSTGADR